MKTHSLTVSRLALESGEILADVVVAYRTWGTLNARGDNAVLVEHALTGSPHLDEWWTDVLGAGRALDPDRDFVVAMNALGSCYGTTGPTSSRSGPGPLWRDEFPKITVRDMVNLEVAAADLLGIPRFSLIVGGSLGGMRALEWAVGQPHRVSSVAALGAPIRHSAWAIGWNAIARKALLADPRFQGGRYSPEDPPRAGLAAARAASMLSYRSFEGLQERFDRKSVGGGFEVERWLDRHGESFVNRFDANAWLTLSLAMDTHDLARGRGILKDVLDGLDVPALFVGISSDVLYPPGEIEAAAARWPGSEYVCLDSPHGHDAFLIEGEAVNAILASFRQRVPPPSKDSGREAESRSLRGAGVLEG